MTNKQNSDTIFYHVRAGDTLSSIIKTYYGAVSSKQHEDIIKEIKNNNSAINNPDKIYPNQLLELNVPQKSTARTQSDTKTVLKAEAVGVAGAVGVFRRERPQIISMTIMAEKLMLLHQWV